MRHHEIVFFQNISCRESQRSSHRSTFAFPQQPRVSPRMLFSQYLKCTEIIRDMYTIVRPNAFRTCGSLAISGLECVWMLVSDLDTCIYHDAKKPLRDEIACQHSALCVLRAKDAKIYIYTFIYSIYIYIWIYIYMYIHLYIVYIYIYIYSIYICI